MGVFGIAAVGVGCISSQRVDLPTTSNEKQEALMTSVIDCELEDLRCNESGCWTLSPSEAPDNHEQTVPRTTCGTRLTLPPQVNRARFPQDAPFREPPEHYLASPAPQAPPPSYDSYARHLKAMMSELHSSPLPQRRPSPIPTSNHTRSTRDHTMPTQTTTLSSGSVPAYHAPSPATTGRSESADEGSSSPTSSSPGSPNGRSHKSSGSLCTSPFSKIPRRRMSNSSPQLPLSKSTSYVPSMRQVTPTPKMESSSDGNDPKTNLQYTVTVCKRSNGNQPWEPSNVRPPMLGKMRRMTVQFAPFEGLAFEVLFQCKDLKPDLHEGRLVVSSNDKGIARNASTLPSLDESLFRTVVQPSEHSSQAISVYLKPCWRGFGSNRERPVFSVTVAVRPAERECAFVILHSWNVELHSHKMESSTKGKAMDANGPFEVRGTIPLHILQQPFIPTGSGTAGASEEQTETCAVGSVPPPLPEKMEEDPTDLPPPPGIE